MAQTARDAVTSLFAQAISEDSLREVGLALIRTVPEGRVHVKDNLGLSSTFYTG